MAKKKEEVKDGEKSKMQTALDKLNKTYGKGTILTLDSKTTGDYEIISSGSIGFDWITLGIGGFAKGKLYELMGWEGVGKSSICGHAAAECQKNNGVVLYIDGEHALDKRYFQALGVDTSKMLIAQPSCGEEGFQIAEDMIKSGEVDLVIIDSDSSLIPKSVIIDGDVGDSAIGKKARLNSNAYPRLKNVLTHNKTCVIIVSQYREKIGVMFGNPTTTQGGHALKFTSDCRIEISKSLAKEGDVTYGNLTKVKSTKNKMSPPYRTAQFEIVYGKGIDIYTELIELANDKEIIKKWGKVTTFGENKFDTDEFKTLLKDNDELFEEIKQEVIKKIKNSLEEEEETKEEEEIETINEESNED